MSLATLPTEIILAVSAHLELRDLNSLLQTCCRFLVLLIRPLYKLGVTDPGVHFLHQAAWWGCTMGARHLLEDGAGEDINARGPLGTTPLHLACSKGREGMVRLLLEKECDLMAADDIGRVALHYAAVEDQAGVVRILLCAGVDRSVCDKFQKTAADLARYHRAESAVQVLSGSSSSQ